VRAAREAALDHMLLEGAPPREVSVMTNTLPQKFRRRQTKSNSGTLHAIVL